MWIFPESLVVDPALANAVGGDPIVAQLLTRRGLTTPEAAAAFLNPDRYVPAPPTELPDLAKRPNARRDLFRSKKYIPFQVVQTMRGCPYPCTFCSVAPVWRLQSFSRSP